MYEFINGASFLSNDLFNLCFLMMRIFLELNNLNLIKNKDKDSSFYKFNNLFLTLKNIFVIQNFDNPEKMKEKEDIKNNFKSFFINYEENKNLLYTILNIQENPQNNENNIEFISKEEKIINEFIDYEKQYRHLLKEQFIFNRLWSNENYFLMKTPEIKN